LIILLVGFSRIALSAHYLTDVLAWIVLGNSLAGFVFDCGQADAPKQIPDSEQCIAGKLPVLVPVQQTGERAQNPLS
jgi:hypothetical protein